MNDKIIYLVMARHRTHSNMFEWPVKAYTNEYSAITHIELATVREKEIAALYEDYLKSEEYKKWDNNEDYDKPKFRHNNIYNSYYISPCKFYVDEIILSDEEPK